MVKLLLPACVLLTAALSVAGAAETSGLPLPRFVSLRSDEVNLRAGPGQRYPIDWIYARKDLPVEVVAEFEAWRKIRDWQGTEGWVHQSMLSGRRMMVVIGGQRQLRGSDSDSADTLAVVEPGVLGRLLQCPRNRDYCRVDVGQTQGWLRRDEIWGVYRGEWLE
ncbi:SH3 domain-containing protein [Magnetospirillum sp. SS-4]|uniref:SH3 domain-containing protein n=1 Tax=Magnetospirillum sp. SS-4 TaxID=2681465 RepID=UPI001574D922|nr:SH3 domain-containing protein [Magnetospirillum sp. SS-4]